MRPRIQPPSLGKALDGRQCDVGPQQAQKKYEPPRVEDIEQSNRIQKTDDLRSIDLLDLPFLGHGPLQNERP